MLGLPKSERKKGREEIDRLEKALKAKVTGYKSGIGTPVVNEQPIESVPDDLVGAFENESQPEVIADALRRSIHDHSWAAGKWKLASASVLTKAATKSAGDESGSVIKALVSAADGLGFAPTSYKVVVGRWEEPGPMNMKVIPREVHQGAQVSAVRTGMPPAIVKGAVIGAVNNKVCLSWSYEEIMAALKNTPRPLEVSFLIMSSDQTVNTMTKTGVDEELGEELYDYPVTEWASLAVTWIEPGTLALKISHEKMDADGTPIGGMVTSVHKGMPEALQPGCVIALLNKEVVLGLPYSSLLNRLKKGERPLTITFLRKINATVSLTHTARMSIRGGLRASLGEFKSEATVAGAGN